MPSPLPQPDPTLLALPPCPRAIVHSFLGFISLMDCRAVSFKFKHHSEKAVVEWMSDNFATAAALRRQQQLIENNKGEEMAVRDVSWPPQLNDSRMPTLPYRPQPRIYLPHSLKCDADSLASFTFTVSDAVWLVQQCRRWQDNNVGDNALNYWLDAATASLVYSTRVDQLLIRWYHGVPTLSLMTIATHQFTSGHADDWAVDLRAGERKRLMERWVKRERDEEAPKKFEAREKIQKLQTERWMKSSMGRPILLQLPSDVVVHSLLSFIHPESLVALRRVSHAFQPLAEGAIVAMMNLAFAAGLSATGQQQEGEAEEQEYKEEETANAHKVTGKRKRREPVAYSSSFSSPPSSSSSAHSSASTPSYTVADTLWLWKGEESECECRRLMEGQ